MDYIIGHYNELSPKDEVIFCQGNPFNHCPDFVQQVANPDYRYYGPVVECNKIGEPHCTFTKLHEWSDILKLPLRDNYKFVAGAQYRLRGSDIKKQSRDFYSAMFYLSKIPNNKAAYVYERLWPVIWEIEL